MCDYIRYGTNDTKEIMLLRYGFEFEGFDWIKNVVESINENEIIFGNVESLSDEQMAKINRYK